MADGSGGISVRVYPDADGFGPELRAKLAPYANETIHVRIEFDDRGARKSTRDFARFSGDLLGDEGRKAGAAFGTGVSTEVQRRGRDVEKSAGDVGRRAGQRLGDQGMLSINQSVKLWSGVITAAAPVAAAGLAAGFAVAFVGIAAAASSTSADVRASFNSLKATGLQEARELGTGTSEIFVRQIGILEDGISGMGSQIARSVNIAGDGIDQLTLGVVDLVQNSLPGMLNLVENSGPIFAGMRSFLSDTGDAVSDLGFDLSAVSGDIGQDFRHLGGIVKSAMDLAGAGLAGAASGFANHGFQIEAAVSGISGTVQQFATGAAPLLGSGLSLALNAVSGFTAALGPVAPAVGAAVTAFSGFRVVRGLKGVFSNAGTSLTQFSKKSGRAGTTVGRFAGILGGVASFAAGPLGIALGVAGLAFAAFGERQAEAAQHAAEVAQRQQQIADTLDRTTGAVTAATRATVQRQLAESGATETARRYGLTLGDLVKGVTGSTEEYNNLTRSIDKFKPTMQEANEVSSSGLNIYGTLEKSISLLAHAGSWARLKGQVISQRQAIEEFAQSTSKGIGLTTFALSQYQAAMSQFNDTTASAQDRAGALAIMMNTLSHSGITTTQAVAGLGNAFRELRDQDFSKVVVDANGRFNALSASGAQLSDNMSAVQQSFLQVGTAMQENGASVGQIRSRLVGLRQQFIRSAQAAGLSATEAKRLADRYGLIPRDVATQIAISGLPQWNQAVEQMRGHIESLKGNKLILDADAAPAAKVLEDMGYKVKQLPSGKFEITAETKEGERQIQDMIDEVKNTKPVLGIDADTKQAAKKFGTFITEVTKTVGTSKLDSNPKPANRKLGRWLTEATKSVGRPTLDSRPQPANQKLGSWLTRATRAVGRSTLDARSGPANAAVGSWLGRAARAVGRSTLAANNGPAWSAFWSWFNRANGATAYATLVVRRVGAAVVAGANFHDGGIVKMYADGGVERKFQPMRAGLAQMVPPNTWRVVGDRAKDDEAYIPVNRSARSIALLEETSRRMGFQLLRMYANGGTFDAQSGSTAALPVVGAPQVVNNISVRDNEDARVVAEVSSARTAWNLRRPR